MSLLEQLFGRGSPAPIGQRVPGQVVALRGGAPVTVSQANMQTTDTWGAPVAVHRGSRISMQVANRPVLVQLAVELPPNPPTWSAPPITVLVGPWSHAGPFGWIRLRSVTPGQAGLVTFTAYGNDT